MTGVNGWADKFMISSVGFAASGAFGRAAHAGKLNLVDDYRADTGGRYGREWNISLGFPVRDR